MISSDEFWNELDSSSVHLACAGMKTDMEIDGEVRYLRHKVDILERERLCIAREHLQSIEFLKQHYETKLKDSQDQLYSINMDNQFNVYLVVPTILIL